MKLLIDLTEEVYEHYKNSPLIGTPDNITWSDEIKKAVRKATPIPDNATNGDVLMTVFPKADIRFEGRNKNFYGYIEFAGDWLEAPYKGR